MKNRYFIIIVEEMNHRVVFRKDITGKYKTNAGWGSDNIPHDYIQLALKDINDYLHNYVPLPTRPNIIIYEDSN